MKTKRLFLTVTLVGLTLLTGKVAGQDQALMSRSEHQRMDSVQVVKDKAEVAQAQREDDANRMADAKEARRKTKAAAKETKRVDRDANAAAREAKMALRAESKAQKARQDADRQSRKATKAKERSDNN